MPSRIFNSSKRSMKSSLDEWTCSASVMNFNVVAPIQPVGIVENLLVSRSSSSP